MDLKSTKYYLPAPSGWPVKASIAFFCLLAGVANWLHSLWFGSYLTLFGFVMLIYVMVGWFGEVIHENRTGLLQGKQVDHSFRYGMCWFIFSEVMFFGAFFGALFYVRVFALPGLDSGATRVELWPQFHYVWPLL